MLFNQNADQSKSKATDLLMSLDQHSALFQKMGLTFSKEIKEYTIYVTLEGQIKSCYVWSVHCGDIDEPTALHERSFGHVLIKGTCQHLREIENVVVNRLHENALTKQDLLTWKKDKKIHFVFDEFL